jgi:alkylated DNA repair dioxygenase AlkB
MEYIKILTPDEHGADVRLYRAYVGKPDADRLLSTQLTGDEWAQEEIVVFGRKCQPNRKTRAMGDKGVTYRYSGKTQPCSPWSPELRKLRSQLEVLCGHPLNFALGNLYEDGNSSIGYHSDDERELKPRASIVSLSLGTSRDFLLQEKKGREGSPKTTKIVELRHGDVLIMAGDTQKNWKHSVPVRKRVRGSRINWTFRWMR